MKKTLRKFMIGLGILCVSFASVGTFAKEQIEYVAVREVLEGLGHEVLWDAANRTAIAKKDGQEIIIQADGENVVIVNDRMMLPAEEMQALLTLEEKDVEEATEEVEEEITEETAEEKEELEVDVAQQEINYFTNAYAISAAKMEESMALEAEYLDGYTFADVVEGKNEEFAEKYGALHNDLEAYEALKVPASLEELHKEILELRREYTAVNLGFILNGYVEENDVAFDAYVENKIALEAKLEAFFAERNINTVEVFGVDTFAMAPLQ